MTRKSSNVQGAIIIILLGFFFSGCSSPDPLTKQQRTALNEMLACHVTDEQLERVIIQKETLDKFPAIEKVFKIVSNGEERYTFEVGPVGYRSTINMLVVIDPKVNQVRGIKVIRHNETPGYGESLTEAWFTNRFQGKSVDRYLKRSILEVEDSNEIIQITGASASSQAVLNGVNSALGTYREVVLGEKAEPVELQLKGFVTETK